MLTANDIISANVPCLSCGYNLRTLSTTSRCPECGTLVTTTLQSTIIRWGPDYLRRLASATSFAAGLNTAAMVGTLLFVGLLAVMAFSHEPGSPSCFAVALLVGYIVIAGLHTRAAFGFTAVPPDERNTPTISVIRTSSILFIFATFVPLCAAVIAMIERSDSQWVLEALLAAWGVLLPSLPIFVFATGRHFANLCHAAGLRTLIPWHHGLSWLLVLGLTSQHFAYLCVLAILLTGMPGSPPKAIVYVLALAFYGGILLAGLAFLAATFLLFRTAHHFRRLADGLTTSPTPPAPTSPAPV